MLAQKTTRLPSAEEPCENRSPVLSPDLEAEVEARRTRALFAQSGIGLAVNILVAGGLGWMLRDAVPLGLLLAWLGGIGTLTAVRGLMLARYRAGGGAESNPARWRARLWAGVALSGGLWGLTWPLFMPHCSEPQQLLLAVVLCGMAAGALPVLASVFSVYVTFLGLSLGPPVAWLFLPGGGQQLIFGGVVVVFIVAMAVVARRFDRSFSESTRADLQHDVIFKRLLRSYRRQSGTNHELMAEIDRRERTESMLRRSEAYQSALFEHSPVALFVSDWSHVKSMLDDLRRDGVRDLRAYFEDRPDALREAARRMVPLDVNARGVEIYRARDKQDYLERFKVYVEEIEWAPLCGALEALDAGERRETHETPELAYDGRAMWVRITREIPEPYADTWEVVIETVIDITEEKRALAALSESEERFRAMAEGSIQGILVHRDWKPLFVNQAYVDLLGFDSADEVLAQRTIADHQAPHERLRMWSFQKDRMQGKEAPRRYEYEAVRKDGTRRILENSVRVVNWNGAPAIQRTVVDVTERRQYETELKRLAATDSLTGVVNRRHLLEQGNREIERARRYGQPLTLLLLDIDHFKAVNDKFGHAVGDLALVKFAQCCQAALRGPDVLGRIGGEEFAVLLPATAEPGARVCAERLRRDVSELEIETESFPLRLTVSIGLAPYVDGDTSIGDTVKRADRALYEAKRSGRNRVISSTATLIDFSPAPLNAKEGNSAG